LDTTWGLTAPSEEAGRMATGQTHTHILEAGEEQDQGDAALLPGAPKALLAGGEASLFPRGH
jgi:hypothetical protein